jgi:hypothetical protein
MKINSKNKVGAILAAVIMSIIFMANTGFTKALAQGMNMSMKGPGKMSKMSMNAPMCP